MHQFILSRWQITEFNLFHKNICIKFWGTQIIYNSCPTLCALTIYIFMFTFFFLIFWILYSGSFRSYHQFENIYILQTQSKVHSSKTKIKPTTNFTQTSFVFQRNKNTVYMFLFILHRYILCNASPRYVNAIIEK